MVRHYIKCIRHNRWSIRSKAGVESSVQSADDALFAAARAADTVPDMIAFLKTVAQADVDYAKALEANLGAYQQAWRNEQVQALSPGHSLIPVWLHEIAYVGSVAGVRNAYMTALGTVSMTYTNTVLDAYGTFNDAVWDAASAFNTSANTAGNTYSASMRSTNRQYAQSVFNAEKSHTMAVFNAEKAKSIGNATVDASGKRAIFDASQSTADNATQQIDDLMALLGNLGENYTYNDWLNSVTATTTSLQQLQQNSPRTAAETTAAAQLTAAEIANAAVYDNAVAVADQKYQNDVNVAGVNYAVAGYTAATTYATAIMGLQNSYGDSMMNAYNTYISAEDMAWNKYVKAATALNEAYLSTIERLNHDLSFDAIAHFNQAATSVANGETHQALSSRGNKGGSDNGIYEQLKKQRQLARMLRWWHWWHWW